MKKILAIAVLSIAFLGSLSTQAMDYRKIAGQVKEEGFQNLQYNLYEILGTTSNATPAEIKKAYFAKAQQYHPDRAPQGKKEEYTKRFQEISNTYEILTNQEKRELYNTYLQNKKNIDELVNVIIAKEGQLNLAIQNVGKTTFQVTFDSKTKGVRPNSIANLGLLYTINNLKIGPYGFHKGKLAQYKIVQLILGKETDYNSVLNEAKKQGPKYLVTHKGQKFFEDIDTILIVIGDTWYPNNAEIKPASSAAFLSILKISDRYDPFPSAKPYDSQLDPITKARHVLGFPIDKIPTAEDIENRTISELQLWTPEIALLTQQEDLLYKNIQQVVRASQERLNYALNAIKEKNYKTILLPEIRYVLTKGISLLQKSEFSQENQGKLKEVLTLINAANYQQALTQLKIIRESFFRTFPIGWQMRASEDQKTVLRKLDEWIAILEGKNPYFAQ